MSAGQTLVLRDSQPTSRMDLLLRIVTDTTAREAYVPSSWLHSAHIESF